MAPFSFDKGGIKKLWEGECAKRRVGCKRSEVIFVKLFLSCV